MNPVQDVPRTAQVEPGGASIDLELDRLGADVEAFLTEVTDE